MLAFDVSGSTSDTHALSPTAGAFLLPGWGWSMAVGFRCSLCERDLKAHCPEGRCHWWTCTNRVCSADLHDFTRGVRTTSTGARERFVAES